MIQRLKNWQDQSSWENFFEIYWKLIYRFAIKSGLTEEEAQDVVQETMSAVARHMPSFKYDPAVGSFKAWLLNMTRWRISDQRAKRQQVVCAESNSTEVNGVLDPSSQYLEAAWNAEWEQHMMEAAMARVRRNLDPQKYQIFDFCVNKGWPPEKVAQAFGVSIDQIYLAKHRVLEVIKEEVARLEREMC
ncbi:MAG: sigma-70 family RNA polymerase sigma factor [Verrucomicrobia bacterium]|nr:sigma-70 family RNA polymerase sigma factor [Verrucomicrobiota bacterium]